MRAGTTYDVPARSLDDLLDESGVQNVDLIKMDIEGGESMALAGMCAGIRRGRYRRLLLELHPVQLAEHGSSPAAIIEGLLEMGYRGWVLGHSSADVRRAAYGRVYTGESLLRPLRWPEPLDNWPHLVFALAGTATVTPGHSGRGHGMATTNHTSMPKLHATRTPRRCNGSPNDKFNPIFIVGHPRSGTTLLATILNRHSEVAVPPELSFFLPAYRRGRRAAMRVGTHKALLRTCAVDCQWQPDG